MNKTEEEHETIVYITPEEVMALTKNSHLDDYDPNEAIQSIGELTVGSAVVEVTAANQPALTPAAVYQAACPRIQFPPTPDPDVNFPAFENGLSPTLQAPFLTEIIFHPTQVLDIITKSPLTPFPSRSRSPDHIQTPTMTILEKSSVLKAIDDISNKVGDIVVRFEGINTDLNSISGKLNSIQDNINKVLEATLAVLRQLEIQAQAKEDFIKEFDDYDVKMVLDPQGCFEAASDVKKKDFPTGVKAGRGGGQGGFCVIM